MLGTVSQLIQEGPSIEQAIVEERSQAAANPPPSVWKEKGEYILLGLMFAFVAVLLVRVLSRHKHEAEIRRLAGTYLRDNVETARMKMPQLFVLPVTPNRHVENDRGDERFTNAPERNPVQEFFAEAPRHLEEMQKALQAVGDIGQGADATKALVDLQKQLVAMKAASNLPELRPVWQVASALELLVTHLTQRMQEATISVLRTVASAIELLHTLCVPGVRPDLIISPPLEVLAVDDDPLCLRAMVFALQKASLKPDVAENGKKALTLATEKVYDVIFLDINMPEMDGLTACSKIRETHTNADTPVVFVTVHSDFQTRAESVVRGGNELIGKPFLILELTVKAMIFAVRKRLQLGQSADGQAKNANPSLVTAVTETISSSPSTMALADLSSVSPSVADERSASGTSIGADLDGDFLTRVPEFLIETQRMLQETCATVDLEKQREGLGKIYLRIHALADKARLNHLTFAARVGVALEALLKRLHQNSKTVSPSALNTVANALKVLSRLCVQGVEQTLAHDTPVRILVVEDEEVARRAVVGTLQVAFEKPDSANDGARALKLAMEKTYDVIFSDLEMPVMGGFGLCTRIREGGPNQNTPLIFITSHIDFESRARAIESGASDFIAKPFLPVEITVKALTFALEGRLHKFDAEVLTLRRDTVETIESTPPQLFAAVNG